MSRRQGDSPWAALPVGDATGIDWSAPGATEGIDPYLAWAETDRFEGYRRGGDSPTRPRWLPVIIELHQGHGVEELLRASSTRWLQVPKAYLKVPGLRYCTARVAKRFFRELARRSPLSRVVSRYELGLPVEEQTGPLHDPARPDDAAPVCPDPVPGHVLAIIDGGLALANTAFLGSRGEPRVRYFWRQDEFDGPHGPASGRHLRQRLKSARSGPRPPVMGYGHELDAKAIRQAMTRFTGNGVVDEDALYDHLQCWDLKHPVNHGTCMASLAAGPWTATARMSSANQTPDMRQATDAARQAPLIAVQLDWANVVDTSGGAMNVSIFDALLYILNRVTDDGRVVVNISWGTLAGPHDGTSILEAGIDQLVRLLGPDRLEVMVPAGNGYQDRTHANQTLAPGESVRLDWHVQPDDHTQSFLELWLGDPDLPEEALQDVSIEVTLPGGKTLEPMLAGHAGCWPGTAQPQLALIYPRRTALGRRGTCALLALCPTASLDPTNRLANAGVWQVNIRNRGFHPVVLDAYIERDDVALGTHTGARQSYLLDADYDISGNLFSFIDDTSNPTPIRRSGVFNSIGTGSATLAVGGIRFASSAFDPAARYSPRIPDPDASRIPQRQGVKKVPDALAVTDESTALWGVLGAGTISGSAIRLWGTSCASPQTARHRYNRG
ncbi:MAG: hypothetical protein KDF54_02440 [Hydrogenophaga sp.]|nr:hypothetical protein [Hydrogenophaga sp.]